MRRVHYWMNVFLLRIHLPYLQSESSSIWWFLPDQLQRTRYPTKNWTLYEEPTNKIKWQSIQHDTIMINNYTEWHNNNTDDTIN